MPLKDFRQRDADLRGEIAKATKARASIGEKAIAESRKLTDEERAAFITAGPVIEQLQAAFAENAEFLQAAEDANAAERAYRGPIDDPDAEAAQKAAAAAGLQNRRIEVPDMTKVRGFFGRQLQAVQRFAAEGGWGHISGEDRTVLQPMLAGPTGLNTDVASEGGFLVAPERSTTILQRAYEIGAILSRVFRYTIGPGSNGVKIPGIDETSRADGSRYGGIVSYWLGQGNAPASYGKPKFREIDLKLRKVGGFVYATDEQLQDAIALEGWVDRYLPLEMTFRTENAVINGTGANQPIGVLNSGALITVTRSNASKVISDDLQNMLARFWAPLRSSAVFFVDQSVEPQLFQLSIAVGTGGVLDPNYRPVGSVPGQVYATYMGIPIIPIEHCAALGTTGDIILTNLGEYVVIDKGGVNQAVSIHVAFLTDESVFRFIYRVDGQCTWNAALTPKSAGDTLSCVVVLS